MSKHPKHKHSSMDSRLRSFVKFDKRIDKALKKVLIGKEMVRYGVDSQSTYVVHSVRSLVKGTRVITADQVQVTAMVTGEAREDQRYQPDVAPFITGDRTFVVPIKELLAALEAEKRSKPKK